MSLRYDGQRYRPPETISSLVDNTSGTANNTLQSIPDSAGALITDLVIGLNTNTLPAIRNDLADLAAKINEILTCLRNNGMIT